VIRGWTAVIVFTTLAVVMMVGVNVRMWRRMKAATMAAKAEAEREAIESDQNPNPRSA
jgi:ABC-type transport system involved in Fe-S cluster assembly fused permease/ATPase subunit